jgi:hypothetical protein
MAHKTIADKVEIQIYHWFRLLGQQPYRPVAEVEGLVERRVLDTRSRQAPEAELRPAAVEKKSRAASTSEVHRWSPDRTKTTFSSLKRAIKATVLATDGLGLMVALRRAYRYAFRTART